MSMLSELQVKRYQEIYKEHYGTKISREQAIEQGIKLIRFVELILEPPDHPEKLRTFNDKPIVRANTNN